MTTYVAIAVYGVLVIALAFWARSSHSVESYLLAGRSVSTLGVGAATFSLVGGGELVALTALAFQFGASAICLFIGYAAGFFVLGLLSSRIRGAADSRIFISLPDFMYYRGGAIAGHITFLCSLGAFFALLMLQFSAGGLLLGQLGGVNTQYATITIGLLVTTYLAIGGFKTVISTDIVQGAARVLLVPILLYAVFENAPNAQASGTGPQSMPLWAAVGLVATGFFTALASADVWQRVYAAKDSPSARKGLWIGALLMLGLGYVLVELGLAAFAAAPTIAADDAFVASIRGGLPEWAVIAAIVLVLISVISTADTEIFLVASLLQAQILRVRGQQNEDREEQSVTRARVLVVGIGIASTCSALVLTDLVSIYLWLIATLLVLSPVVVCSLILSQNSKADTTAIVLGFALFTILALSGHLTLENAFLIVVPGFVACGLLRKVLGARG